MDRPSTLMCNINSTPKLDKDCPIGSLQVYGVEWNPYEISHKVPPAFLQFGKKHIKVRWWGCCKGFVRGLE